MKQQDELFMLIKSMDKNEKGYFRKFSKLHGSNREGNYLKLFDCMSSMDEYSDAKIREQFKAEKFTKSLNSTKHYLKNLIIRALRNYHEDKLPALQSLLSMADVQVMAHKKMNDGLPIRLEKEMKNALDKENFAEYLLWSKLHLHWLNVYGLSNKLFESKMKLMIERRVVMNQILNLNEYIILNTEVANLVMSHGDSPSSVVLKKYENCLMHPLLTTPNAALSVQARQAYIATLSTLYKMTGQRDKAIKLLKDEIKRTSKNYNGTFHSPYNFLVILDQYVDILGRKKMNEKQMMIRKFNEVMHTYKDSLSPMSWWRLEIGCLFHQCDYNLYKQNAQKVLILTSEIKAKLKGNPKLFIHQEIIRMSMEAKAFIELEHYDKALDIVNAIHNGNYKIRRDIFLNAEWMKIIINIELGNYKLVETLIKQTYRQNVNNNIKLVCGNKLYTHFRLISQKIKLKNKSDIQSVAKDFLQFLETKAPYDFEYVKFWLDKKIEGKV